MQGPKACKNKRGTGGQGAGEVEGLFQVGTQDARGQGAAGEEGSLTI